MNNKNPALLSHISQETISLAYCCKITPISGSSIALTDIDRNLEIDGTSYRAEPGLTVRLIEHSLGLSTANVETLSESEIFSEAALSRGVFDNAHVEIFVVNYEDISQGSIAVFTGAVVEVTLQNGIFKATLRGGMNTIKEKVGTLFSPQCRAQFCDKECMLKAARYTFKGSISTVTDEFKTFKDFSLLADAGYYTHGIIKFLTGQNANFSSKVQSDSEQCIYLATSTPHRMLVNDKYSIVAGCDKNFRTCVQKFSNAKNFRGEPHVPDICSIYKNMD